MDISIRIGNVVYTYVKTTNVVARDMVQYYVQSFFISRVFRLCSSNYCKPRASSQGTERHRCYVLKLQIVII